jgi:DNA-binding transcriptional ArsR family regulator
MEENTVIKAFAALAHPMRLKVFRALVVAGHGGMTPTAIVQQLGLPAATLSFHLKELNHAGLVTQEREGRRLIYRAAYDQMDALIAFMKDNCCAGLPVEATASAACAC